MRINQLYALICVLTIGTTLFCGCKSDISTDDDSSEEEQMSLIHENISLNRIDLSELQAEKGSYSQYSNPVVYYSEDELLNIISHTTNFKIAGNCNLLIPKTIDHVSTFHKKYEGQDEPYDFYKSFLEMYKYLFPDESIDENALFYYGANSNNADGDENLKTIGHDFSQFVNENKEDIYFLFYSPCFYDGQVFPEGEKNKFLELSSPVGTIMTNFNKGTLSEYISKKRNASNRYFLETYTSPNMFSEFNPNTGTFSGFSITDYKPDASTMHTMLDGRQLSVSDAVSLFEDYINSLPYPEAPNLDIGVTKVSAIEIEDNRFCYAFECTVLYEGIPFDYMQYGSSVLGGGNDGYEPSVRMGYMTVSDDVDAAYGFCRSMSISERNDSSLIVSFENALKCCADNLSDYADWELKSAELVYCAGNGKKAQPPYQDMEYDVSPCYKFVLYNANDNLCYSAYINAISGMFVRYYKTNG